MNKLIQLLLLVALPVSYAYSGECDIERLEDEFLAGYLFANPIGILEEAKMNPAPFTFYDLREGFSIEPKNPKKRFHGSVIHKRVDIDNPELASKLFEIVIGGIFEGCRQAVEYSENGTKRMVSLPDYPDWPRWGTRMEVDFNGDRVVLDMMISTRRVFCIIEGLESTGHWIASSELKNRVEKLVLNHLVVTR